MSAPTEQQVAGRTSDTVNTAKTKKNTRKNGKFKRNQVKFFFAGLPPRTPVRTHTPVSRYGPSAPRVMVTKLQRPRKRRGALWRTAAS